MDTAEQGKKLGQVIAKYWADEAFKKQLSSNPVATLKAEGVNVPEGLSVKVLENTDKIFHLVIPPKPTDLSEADLYKVAAGQDGCTCDHPGRTYTGSIITVVAPRLRPR